MTRFCLATLMLFLTALPSTAQPRSGEPQKTPTISEKVAGMEKFPGYFPFYWDAKSGKIWLEIDR